MAVYTPFARSKGSERSRERMTVSPEVTAQVTAVLREEKLAFDFDPSSGQWSLPFIVEGKTQTVWAFQGDADYLYIYSPIASDQLKDKSLDVLPSDVLRTLIRVSSEVALAKFLFAPPSLHVAVSECSVHGLSGPKMRRRLEAVARLAAKLELALV